MIINEFEFGENEIQDDGHKRPIWIRQNSISCPILFKLGYNVYYY